MATYKLDPNLMKLQVLKTGTDEEKAEHYLTLLKRSLRSMAGIDYIAPSNDELEEKKEVSVKQKFKSNGAAAGSGYAGSSNDPKLFEKMQKKAQENKANTDRTVKDLKNFEEFLTKSLANRPDKSDKIYDSINISCLNVLLSVFLRESSMLDILPKVEAFKTVFNILDYCSKRAFLIPIFGVERPYTAPQFRNHTDLTILLSELKNQANLFLMGKSKDEQKSELEEFASTVSKSISQIESQMKKSLKKFNKEFAHLSKHVKSGFKKEEKVSKDVEAWLRSQKFAVVDLSKETFYYKNQLQNAGKQTKKKMTRLRKEMAILSNSLPDGVYVRVDENRFDMMKVMIVGPEGTPYENGCFLFDLFIPSQYPDVCPQMKYLTTGGGKVYINPNLYQCGKICLSLLGTWNGPGWDPKTSTLLQLIISIQALVLVPYPYINEPCYSSQWDSVQSKAYSKGVRKANALYAMLWHFDKPAAPCFDEVIKAHFYTKRNIIKEVIAEWDKHDAKITTKCGYNDFDRKGILSQPHEEVKKNLFKRFDKLTPPKM